MTVAMRLGTVLTSKANVGDDEVIVANALHLRNGSPPNDGDFLVVINSSVEPPIEEMFKVAVGYNAGGNGNTIPLAATGAVGATSNIGGGEAVGVGAVQHTVAVPVGGIVEQRTTSVPVYGGTDQLAQNSDFVMNWFPGSVRFIDFANLAAGRGISAHFHYNVSLSKQINVGKVLPELEYRARIQQFFPDGRKLEIFLHRVSINPDNANLNFEPTDWIGTEFRLSALLSDNPAHADNPLYYITIDDDPVTGQQPLKLSDSYNAGIFEVFITPLDANKATARGLPTEEFSLGNVKTGSHEQAQEFLDHFIGLRQIKDKSIKTKVDPTIVCVVENIRPANLSMLFEGTITSNAGGQRLRSNYTEVPADSAVLGANSRQFIPVSLDRIDLYPL